MDATGTGLAGTDVCRRRHSPVWPSAPCARSRAASRSSSGTSTALLRVLGRAKAGTPITGHLDRAARTDPCRRSSTQNDGSGAAPRPHEYGTSRAPDKRERVPAYRESVHCPAAERYMVRLPARTRNESKGFSGTALGQAVNTLPTTTAPEAGSQLRKRLTPVPRLRCLRGRRRSPTWRAGPYPKDPPARPRHRGEQ